MRLIVIAFIVIFLWSGCQEESYEANVPPIPERLDTLTDDYNGRSVPKVRKIFRKGIEYQYRAVYADVDGNIVSDNTVRIRPTGERWKHQPERQDVVEIFLSTTPEERERVLADPINKTYPLAEYWTEYTMEGVIENAEKVWIHPIRTNQYLFTEVAPFPEIKLPPTEGQSWTATISGLGGWGDWDGAVISSTYQNNGQEVIATSLGRIECWAIEAESTFELGKSTALFHFHEDLGFVKMSYYNYRGESLVFVMEKVVQV